MIAPDKGHPADIRDLLGGRQCACHALKIRFYFDN
jgi:hypothetical protein